MKTINKKYVLAWLLPILFLGCSKEKYVGSGVEDQAPGPVTEVRIAALAGGAQISYKLPSDPSLRYVKAVYEIRPGVTREVIASLYTNHLVVDGFPEIKAYSVKLYTVSYGENISMSPVTVEVTPLTPPLKEAFNTLKMRETFGGATLSFENSGLASLAVTVLTPDSTGKMSEVETYYTKAPQGLHSVRGFKSEPRIFAAVVRDRWNNLSDTLYTNLTPVFEEPIPKSTFKGLFLPSDTYAPHAADNNTLDKLFDDRIAPNGGVAVFHTKPGSGMPQWFTIDMGRMAILSRYKFFHRGPGATYAYQLGDPKTWEVWGSATAPDPTGGGDGWTKLMDCHSYKPSGEGNPVTSEDAVFATSTGEDFIFPENTPPVRYLRFRILETWGYLDYIYMMELSFWGQLQ